MCLQTSEHLALYSEVIIFSSKKTETGELNECITGCAGCETWKSNRISTLWNHSVIWRSTFPVMTNRFGKTTECRTTRAETPFLDEVVAINRLFTRNFYGIWKVKVFKYLYNSCPARKKNISGHGKEGNVVTSQPGLTSFVPVVCIGVRNARFEKNALQMMENAPIFLNNTTKTYSR